MRARDQSSIFSPGGKFCPDYGLLLELHAVTLVACSYALLATHMNPTLNGSFVLQRFKRGNAVEIRNRIMFDFCPGLPHILGVYRR